MPKRTGSAKWEGSIGEGGGTVALGSGAFQGPYSFRSRFEEGDGTNPEELIAAAHAGCFSMALSLILGTAGHEPESIETDATVRLSKAGDGFAIDRIELRTTGRVPGIDADEFRRHAEAAKDNCPVSKALSGVDEITLDAELAG
ncbi:MAG: OsmC family peroxiredoxin [Solirubrobacterales bacterium]|nr:OsmC family peroxiredoxin [Solirubrobacterales bacterium]